MSQPNRPSSDDVYNQRALTIGFIVFAVLEAVAIVWVVHVAVDRWPITVGVAALFVIVIVGSFAYSQRRNRENTETDPVEGPTVPSPGNDHATSEAWSQLPAAEGPSLVEVRDVDVTAGSQRILDVKELVVHGGELVALSGRNGSGKTTLLRAIGSLIPYHGDIVTNVPIGFMPDRPALYSRLTGKEHMALVMAMRDHPRPSRRTETDELLRRFDLADAADRRVRGWSLGMRRKLSLTLAMCGEPGLLLLDEPGDGLDEPAFDELGRVLVEHLGRGGAAMIATHDHRILDSAHRVVMLEKGLIVEGGS